MFEGDDLFLRYVNTKEHVADIFMKGFNNGEAWSACMDLCSLFSVEEEHK